MSHTDILPLLEKVSGGKTLDAAQSAEAFGAIMAGRVADDKLAEFLIGLAERNPTVPEIVGAAQAMRANMLTLEAPEGAIDVCGTGGDGHATLNVSTAVSLVVAGCGVAVAKHGNRSMSSRSGAADVLEALGVRIGLGPDASAKCLRDAGVAFLFAQTFHPAMKHVAAVRRRIGMRTIFNLLGPLCNPAKVRRQLMGVYAMEWVEPIAHVLARLGTEKAWVVHGRDGLDELTTTGPTVVAMLENGTVTVRTVAPEEIGLPRATLDQLKGGDAALNARALKRLLNNESDSAYRDIVVLNAAAALVVADKASNLKDGAAMAGAAIDDGRARAVLDKLVAASGGVTG